MNEVIKKIELDIDGVGITLTPEQARKLQGALNELLGVEKEKEYIPSPYPVPQPYPVYPPYRPGRWTDIVWTWPTTGTITVGDLPATYSNVDSSVKMVVQ